jgi:hypothetical protein
MKGRENSMTATSTVEELEAGPEKWNGRQFMFWFADVEQRLDVAAVTPAALLRNANSNWRTLRLRIRIRSTTNFVVRNRNASQTGFAGYPLEWW